MMAELRVKLESEIQRLKFENEDFDLGESIQAAFEAYETARMDGLCHEGAWEVAISALCSLNTPKNRET